MSILHTYKMLNEDEDIRPITWEMREEYVDRMLQREYPGDRIEGSEMDKFKEYYRYAYDEYHVWGHELTAAVFSKALLADVKDMGGPWWRADLFERNWSDDDECEEDECDDVGHCGCAGTQCLGTCAQSDA